MAFVLTLIYVALTVLSPEAFPEAIKSLHLGYIFGVLAILAVLPSIPRAKLGSIPEAYLAIGLFVSVCVSILLTGWFGGAAQATANFGPILLAFYFVVISCRSLLRLKILSAVLFIVALYIFSQGARDYFSGNFLSPYLEPETLTAGVTLYRFRGLGIISDPNDLAQFFVMLIPLLWLWWKPGHFGRNLVFTMVPGCILAAAIYYTHSRGAIIAVIAVILFGLKDKVGVVKASIFAAIAFAALIALNASGGRGMNNDDGGRIAAWSTGLELVKAHPLFGVGVGNFSDYNDTGLTAHNSYILSLAETGLIGYFFWMGMIVFVWIGLSKMIPSQSKKTSEIDSDRAVVKTRLNTSALSYSAPYVSERNDSGVRWPHYPGAMVKDDRADVCWEDDDLIYSAKVFRVAFVGLLTSSFFISRTYSVTLYVLLGMAVALRLVYQEKHPDYTTDRLLLLKRACVAIPASVVLLYMVVRLRGIQ